MSRPRITFGVPLTRDDGQQPPVLGLPVPTIISQAQRLERMREQIRTVARETHLRRRQLGYWHHDHCRYVYRRLREAWADALRDAAPGMRSDGKMAETMLRHAIDKLQEIRLLVMGNLEREAVRDEQRQRAAIARAQRSDRKAADSQGVLRRAEELRQRNPSLSDRAIAERLEAEIGTKAGTIRRWLAGR